MEMAHAYTHSNIDMFTSDPLLSPLDEWSNFYFEKNIIFEYLFLL